MTARLAILFFSLSIFSFAAETKYSEATPNISITSDYIARGQTQTEHGPAIQGGIDWAHPVGVYAGAWGSNVSFGEEDPASLEVDLYGGYKHTLSEDWAIDLGVSGLFYYPQSLADSWEIPLKISWKTLSASIAYDPPTEGEFFDGGWYAKAAWSDNLFEEVTVGLAVGYTVVAKNDPTSNYANIHLNMAREVLGATLDASFYCVTPQQFGSLDDSRFVVSILKSF